MTASEPLRFCGRFFILCFTKHQKLRNIGSDDNSESVMAYPQYYKDLGVKETASMDEIKQAYRELAKKYHPDANNGDKKSEEKLKKVNEAYAVLKDYGRRAEYDYEGQLARERAQKVQKAQTYAASTATAPQSAYYAGNTAAERPARRWLKILIHELFAFGLTKILPSAWLWAAYTLTELTLLSFNFAHYRKRLKKYINTFTNHFFNL